jgi:methylamine--corrinoid protein Co-methyltransferase
VAKVVERPIDVYETYNRSMSGPKVPERDWDYKIIPMNSAKMKEKYGIKFGPEIIPTDKELIDNLFQAGLEMLVETGIYNIDTGRVIKVTEEEVLEGIKKAPKKLVLGEYKDAVDMIQRRGNAAVKPVIQGGPTGAPVSEDIFIQMFQSYAQEPVVDTIVNGVLATIEGNEATSGSPWEIKATLFELYYIREACRKAGRPYMAV